MRVNPNPSRIARTRTLGGAYIDPPSQNSPNGTDAVVSSWVVDEHASDRLQQALDQFMPP